jgi:hypothetical protein
MYEHFAFNRLERYVLDAETKYVEQKRTECNVTGRGPARQNQRPDTDFEQSLGKKAFLNWRMRRPEHAGRQACPQCIGPALVRHLQFPSLRLLGALERHVGRHACLR